MTSNTAAICIAALLAGGLAPARAYQPGEVFRLDLNHAALSPQPIGPPAQFEPVPVEAKDEAKDDAAKPAAKAARAAKVSTAAKASRLATKRLPATKKQTVRRSNPLDANASDTRVQVWPCRSGGICSWRSR
jgi:hypothetical protein